MNIPLQILQSQSSYQDKGTFCIVYSYTQTDVNLKVQAPGNDNLRGFTAFLGPEDGALAETDDTLFAGEFDLVSLLQQTVFKLFGFLGVKEYLTSQGRTAIQRSFQLQPQLVFPSS